jgi:predicted  nucleic acid-binding Zn-ribbon protein
MDPDTSKKVSDLLDLMEGISSDVDAKSSLTSLAERIDALESQIADLSRRFEQFEKMFKEKRGQVKAMKQDLLAILNEGS